MSNDCMVILALCALLSGIIVGAVLMWTAMGDEE